MAVTGAPDEDGYGEIGPQSIGYRPFAPNGGVSTGWYVLPTISSGRWYKVVKAGTLAQIDDTASWPVNIGDTLTSGNVKLICVPLVNTVTSKHRMVAKGTLTSTGKAAIACQIFYFDASDSFLDGVLGNRKIEAPSIQWFGNDIVLTTAWRAFPANTAYMQPAVTVWAENGQTTTFDLRSFEVYIED